MQLKQPRKKVDGKAQEIVHPDAAESMWAAASIGWLQSGSGPRTGASFSHVLRPLCVRGPLASGKVEKGVRSAQPGPAIHWRGLGTLFEILEQQGPEVVSGKCPAHQERAGT